MFCWPEWAKDVHADDEKEEANDGETEVGVGHYDGDHASVRVLVNVHQTLRVVGGGIPGPLAATVEVS